MEMGMAKATTSRGKGNSSGRAGTQGARVRSAPSPSNPATPVVFGSARAILRGELDKIGLSTLLTILEMERRTGILVLQRRRQLGRLHVRDGQIIRARIEGHGRQSGTEAVYQMLAWQGEAGQFELWQAEVEGADEIWPAHRLPVDGGHAAHGRGAKPVDCPLPCRAPARPKPCPTPRPIQRPNRIFRSRSSGLR